MTTAHNDDRLQQRRQYARSANADRKSGPHFCLKSVPKRRRRRSASATTGNDVRNVTDLKEHRERALRYAVSFDRNGAVQATEVTKVQRFELEILMADKERNGKQRSSRRLKPRKEPILDNHIEGDFKNSPVSEFTPVGPADLPTDRIIKRLRQLKCLVTGRGPKLQAICPAHSDTNASLSITETAEGNALLHCHAGCPTATVLERLGLRVRDLFASLYALQNSKRKPQGTIHFCNAAAGRLPPEPIPMQSTEWTERLSRLRRRQNMIELGVRLKLDPESLRAIHAAFNPFDNVSYFPEHNDRGELVGVVCRNNHNEKRAIPGSSRGLTLVRYKDGAPRGPLYVAEGATDAAALHMAGVFAIGRSTANSSAWERIWLLRHLRRFPKRRVVVLGDRDRSEAGSAGAKDLSEFLANCLERDVFWALPQKGFKDVREQITAGQWSQGLEVHEVRV